LSTKKCFSSSFITAQPDTNSYSGLPSTAQTSKHSNLQTFRSIGSNLIFT
jgi:hypothetical protein